MPYEENINHPLSVLAIFSNKKWKNNCWSHIHCSVYYSLKMVQQK